MINIENLSYLYPGTDVMVLRDVGLQIEKGSLFGLLGPNGAGKTTLISILTGLLKTFDGCIEIGGFKLPGSIRQTKQLIGYVPQDYAFYEELTALENLQFFAGIQQVNGELQQTRITFCLDFCQLQAVARQRVATFSGGLKRRLNIAIGLLTDPDILIFDEPTVSIDPQSRAFILQQIKALQQQGKTIIYTSHYMEEVEQICDQVAIIDHGQVLMQDSVKNLQKNQQLLIAYSGKLEQKNWQHLSASFNVSNQQGLLTFNDIATMAEYHQAIKQLQDYNVAISSIHYGKANLEKLFLDMTSKELRDN